MIVRAATVSLGVGGRQRCGVRDSSDLRIFGNRFAFQLLQEGRKRHETNVGGAEDLEHFETVAAAVEPSRRSGSPGSRADERGTQR